MDTWESSRLCVTRSETMGLWCRWVSASLELSNCSPKWLGQFTPALVLHFSTSLFILDVVTLSLLSSHLVNVKLPLICLIWTISDHFLGFYWLFSFLSKLLVSVFCLFLYFSYEFVDIPYIFCINPILIICITVTCFQTDLSVDFILSFCQKEVVV